MADQFISKVWKDTCNRWETQHWTTAIYHPRANPAERRNQKIRKGLRLHLQDEEHGKWDFYLPAILLQLRSRRNAATCYTPAQLLLRHDLQRPGNWKIDGPQDQDQPWEQRVTQVTANQYHYKEKCAKADSLTPYVPGTSVYVKTHPLSKGQERHSGFMARWEGPLRVHRRHSTDIYLIDRGGSFSPTRREPGES